LAGHIELQALSYVPVAFLPDSGCELALHGHIVAYSCCSR
jgi:hypothetical protein